METATHPSAATLAHREKNGTATATPCQPKASQFATEANRGSGAPPPDFGSLHLETRTAVDTATAAFHLNRQPQTLRGWACHEDGPLRPVRVHGRLAWKVADLRRLMGVAQ